MKNNGSLTTDLESIRRVFNEKEKELAMAVTKVIHFKVNYFISLFPRFLLILLQIYEFKILSLLYNQNLWLTKKQGVYFWLPYYHPTNKLVNDS